MEIRSAVPSNMNGTTLLEYLTKRFTYLSRSDWINRIEENRFTVNGNVGLRDTVLHGGDTVMYDMPPLKEPPADLAYTVIFECERFLAINKPGNLLVHKSGRSITHNLIYQLRECHEPPFKEVHVVNRLDRETSGLVLIAKDVAALKVMNRLFEERKIQKEYLAIVEGIPEKKAGEIKLDICKGDSSRIRSKHRYGAPGGGKSAVTRYTVEKSSVTHSLVRLWPKTGRVHQLRLHCLSLGCPIIGDKLYNTPEEKYLHWVQNKESAKPFDVSRQMLHCCNLQFELFGESYNISAPLPDDFTRQLSLKVDIT